MHAGVVNFRVQPGRMEEAVQIYLGSIVPAMREQHGFRNVLVLTDHETGEGTSSSKRWGCQARTSPPRRLSGQRRSRSSWQPHRSTASRYRHLPSDSTSIKGLETTSILQCDDLVPRADPTAFHDPGADASAPL
jgi:hypothetical protein